MLVLSAGEESGKDRGGKSAAVQVFRFRRAGVVFFFINQSESRAGSELKEKQISGWITEGVNGLNVNRAVDG